MVSLSTNVTSSSVWFVDSGASCHMSGDRQNFTRLNETDIDLEMVLGDNSKVRATCALIPCRKFSGLVSPLIFNLFYIQVSYPTP